MSVLAFTPSASVTLTLTTAQSQGIVGGWGHYMRIVNGAAGNCWLLFYEATATPPVVAAAAAMLIPPGAIEVFSVASDTTRVALTGDATGTIVNLTRGEGQ